MNTELNRTRALKLNFYRAGLDMTIITTWSSYYCWPVIVSKDVSRWFERRVVNK